MKRVAEPELMDDAAHASAYAAADFEEPHARFIDLFRATFPDHTIIGEVLDLGCGPADISLRFARAYPQCIVHGIDGAEAMLAEGRARLAREDMTRRVKLSHGYLPGADLPAAAYAAVISNSLLHHLRDPAALWSAAKHAAQPGAPLFIMDLRRPASRRQAEAVVNQYAAREPAVLRHDFFCSLLAAYRADEVTAQLAAAGLAGLTVEEVSDRHLLVHGHLP